MTVPGIRAGQGFDAHAFEAGRKLVIGGVEIPDVDGLAGHSDGDVLAHAVADALLGAAGLGDLGERFPATPEWREASSIAILEDVVTALAGAGWQVVNVDATVVAEAPRLAPLRDAMRANLAGALRMETGTVSIKATTTDTLGFTGRGEGMCAFAVVLIGPASDGRR